MINGRSKTRYGKLFINFTPAVSNESRKVMRHKIHYWRMYLRPDKLFEYLLIMSNPLIMGGYNYFKNF